MEREGDGPQNGRAQEATDPIAFNSKEEEGRQEEEKRWNILQEDRRGGSSLSNVSKDFSL